MPGLKGRWRRPLIAVLLTILVLVSALRWWLRKQAATLQPRTSGQQSASGYRRDSDDPRLALTASYQNVRPGVEYVGDQSCTRCHAELVRSYHQHPMGRSLVPLKGLDPLQQDDKADKAGFRALGFHYRIERRANGVVHREWKEDQQGRVVAEIEAEVQFAVGSGRRGQSYLINHEGFLFESPITWYEHRRQYDLSPGYASRNHHFARPVPAECLFCHSNRALEIPDTANHYRPPIFQGDSIGCERCHGPGELHVRARSRGEALTLVDSTIVNPRRLNPALREAVCEQCHLQGEVRVLRRGRGTYDFRPSLPLQRFFSVFVRQANSSPKVSGTRKSFPAESKRFVGQVEQMHASRCFRASGGQMGCTTCHDPHQLPAAAERIAYYRERCLSCHGEESCTLPAKLRAQRSEQDSCIDCHMPAGKSDIPHTSTTDHRIPRQAEAAASEPAMDRLRLNELPLVPFYQYPTDSDLARDLGIALMDRVDRYAKPIRKALGQRALPLLEKALQADGRDLAAWEAKAAALWSLGRTEEAAAAFETILTQSPEHEAALHSAATLAMEREQPAAARNYWERALRVNPWRYEFHYGLAAARAQLHDWPGAVVECRKALELNPFHFEVRKVLIRCYLALGEKERARNEFERLLALEPPEPEALKRWYAAHQNQAPGSPR